MNIYGMQLKLANPKKCTHEHFTTSNNGQYSGQYVTKNKWILLRHSVYYKSRLLFPAVKLLLNYKMDINKTFKCFLCVLLLFLEKLLSFTILSHMSVFDKY